MRVTSRSSIQLDFVWQGKRYRERLRLSPTPPNLRYAARLKATIEHEIATRTFDFQKHFPESRRGRTLAGASIESAMTAYCDSLEGSLEPETIYEYRKDAALIAGAFGADKPLSTLTRADVRTWVAKSSLSKKRLDNLLIPLRGAIRQAIEDGQLTANPLDQFKIKRASKPGEKIDPFTPAEITALSAGELGPLWAFWVWTGLRTGELIGLHWGDVGDGRIHVHRAVRVGREKAPKTKSGKRALDLLPAARAALAALQRGSGPVFVNPNTSAGWYEDRALARAFRKACKAAGVRYRYPYQLRHTFATWALSSGENPAWIAQYMGHADVMVLYRVYGKWMPALDPRAGSRMVSAAGKAA